MDAETFEAVFDRQVKFCTTTLIEKAREYATEDRLHNFKTAATLQNTDCRSALAGMMAKHTVSIYDLIEAQKLAPQEVWDEKITDHINYLILLQAIVKEERGLSEPKEWNFPTIQTGYNTK